MAGERDLKTGQFLKRDPLDIIESRLIIDDLSTCWGLKGFHDKDGYTRVCSEQGHRYVWTHLVGPIDDDFQIDHLCINPGCTNPDHLEPVSPLENVSRSTNIGGTNHRKTHCVNGHEFNDTNTYVPPKRPGRRYCKLCQVNNTKRFNHNHKGD